MFIRFPLSPFVSLHFVFFVPFWTASCSNARSVIIDSFTGNRYLVIYNNRSLLTLFFIAINEQAPEVHTFNPFRFQGSQNETFIVYFGLAFVLIGGGVLYSRSWVR